MDSDIFQDTDYDGVEEYEEELTAAEVLQKLEDAWLNEKHSPELLDPKMEIVECMLEQVNNMNENLSRLKKGDLRIPVHRMEISRIKFLINSYLRVRLAKIQSYIFHYKAADSLGQPNSAARMTPEEATFAESYCQDLTSHFSSLAMRHMPGDWDPARLPASVPGPNLAQAVFVEVKADCPGLEVSDPAGLGRDDTVELVRGDQLMVQYSSVARILEEGSIQLI